MPYVTNELRVAAALALACSSLLLAVRLAHAQTSRLDEADAVREAMAHNPSLRATLYDYQQAQQEVLAEEWLYVPTLSLDTGVTHSENPRLTGDSTTVGSNDSIDVGAELGHTFPWGTAFSFRLEGSRFSSSSQYAAGEDRLVTTGPGYSLLGRLSVTQPLLRGFGLDVGESSLRQAELSRTSAEKARDREASEMLRDVLLAYWELWYTDEALRIERNAESLARRRLEDQQRKIELGAGAPVDALSFETRAGELESSVLNAESQQRTQSLQMGLMLGRDAPDATEIHAAADAVPAVPERDRSGVLRGAVEESLTVAQQKLQLQLARERALVAGESERPRLDLEAYLQTQGLGNREVPPAFEQFGTFGAVSAHVGLLFQLPLSGARHSAQRRGAEASAEAARERLHAALQQARTDAATELVKLAKAKQQIDLATKIADVAERNATAQQKRYAKGDAILLEVHEAEDELTRARLAVQRSRVDAIQSAIRIDHLTGDLLRRYGAAIPKQPLRSATWRHQPALANAGLF
ncbi:MAG: TolC family protein [Deltaproteobacteria bacterium]|jgi:outer membrane protein TolC|nr:TolC family protein [Deltaproteobacteria bacterium]MBW2533014.1 TolC family protein [Deltaproteobacteria bacterium]